MAFLGVRSPNPLPKASGLGNLTRVTEMSKSPASVEKLANVYGDSYFLAPNLDFSKMLASNSTCPVFQYRFSYCPPASLLDVMLPNIPKLICR